MAEPHAHSQPIETYGLAPHNRNIWPSPTPTANQYKHMAQRRIIETYGHTIAGRRSFVTPSRFFCLFFKLQSNHYSPCTNSLSIVRGGFVRGVIRGSFVWKVLSGVVFVRSPFYQNTSVTAES